jgi:mannose-6-phosphate isomerase-like protein (cupin superfamily)
MNAPAETSVPGVEIVNVMDIKPVVQSHRQTVLRTAEFEDPRDGRRFRCGFSRRKQDNYYSPPHRHTFDQLRFVIDGKTKYGPMRLGSGDFAYFPEGVFYGPTESLSEDLASCTIQTQGPSWGAFPNDTEVSAAGARLKGRGEMDRATGQFIWNDGRKQDSFEAMLEEILGGPTPYPPGRFRAPVQFHTGAFEWIAAGEGVERKPMARFNAGGPDVEMLRVKSGATLSGSRAQVHRMWVVFSGEGHCGEVPVSEGCFIYSPPGSEIPPLRAREDTVIFAPSFEAGRSRP